MTFPNNKNWEVGKLTYMKRGDGHLGQFPTALRIQYFDQDKRKWLWYKNGAWIPTNIKRSDPTKMVHNDPLLESIKTEATAPMNIPLEDKTSLSYNMIFIIIFK